MGTLRPARRELVDEGGSTCAERRRPGLPWKGGNGKSGGDAAPLSHDFRTGAWQEWLGPEDLQVDLGRYYFVAIIPEK
jgi:hypothetical protein